MAEKSWQALGQNAVMQQQWEKLGFTAETAADLINKRFDYAINPIALIATAVVVVGYFWFVVRFSEREYREVIAERFGEPGRPSALRRPAHGASGSCSSGRAWAALGRPHSSG